MDGIASEVSQKLKSAIKAKLMELGAYVDDELSNYVMVMVTNRRSKAEMDRELQLFLAGNTSAFTNWLQSVWQKLEQVTITNPGIEPSKRKVPDKKKKAKKVIKSSPESSEDEKKRKKKRKSSDSSLKDTKKRKPDGVPDEKKNKKDDFHLHSESESDNDQLVGNFTSNMNKKFSKDTSADSSIDEEEFLNIKEDFESELFLSNNEFSEGNSKSRSVTNQCKMSHKSDIDVTLKRNKDDRSVANTMDSKEDASRNNAVQTASKISKTESDHNTEVKGKTIIIRKPLVRDFKAGSPPKIKTLRHSPSPRVRSHSRSRSTSQTKIVQLRHKNSKSPSRDDVAKEDFNKKIQRSRLKSAATSGISVDVKSRSRSRSPLHTAASIKMKIKEQSLAVLDARELINRKRAICVNSDSISTKEEEMSKRMLAPKVNVDANETDEQSSGKQKKLGTATSTISGDKMIRLRDRESYKQDCLVTEDGSNVIVDDDDDWVDNDGNQLNENRKVTTALKLVRKFVVNKSDGKRSVIVQSSSDSKSLPMVGNIKAIDLRDIRRTVFMEDGGGEENRNQIDDDQVDATEIDFTDEEKRIKKDHVMQYIKPEKVVSSTVVKLPKPPRPKSTAAQSASSTLIRKAMADAHKSLASSKEDSFKKREAMDSKSMVCRERNASAVTTQVQIFDDDEMSPRKQSKNDNDDDHDDDDERLSPKSTRGSDDRMDDKSEEDENLNKCDDKMNEAEEYDPSMNMPQFVVTLTGLDPKLYPAEDADELMNTFNEDLDSTVEDGNKYRPKLQERCKYYPNCLAGDQCLYYHPTISCKLFPNCKFGSNCLYFHPKCKFDNMCTRYDCTFSHTTPRIVAPVTARHSPAPNMMNAQPCKFYYNCVNPTCPFQHPKICRFDRCCTNKNCTFSHTSLSHVSSVSKDKLKWSRPKEDSSITSDTVEQKQQNNLALSSENY